METASSLNSSAPPAGQTREALERNALQQQIAFFVEKIAGASGNEAAASLPLSRKSRGSLIGGSSTESSTSSRGLVGGGARDLVRGVLSQGNAAGDGPIAARSASKENDQPQARKNSCKDNAENTEGVGDASWLWSSPDHYANLNFLRAALEAEEEALLADIQFLQSRVCDTAGESRDLSAQTLRARKAELQKKWLEVEAKTAVSLVGNEGPSVAASLQAPSSTSLRLHKILKIAPTTTSPPSDLSRVSEPSAPTPQFATSAPVASCATSRIGSRGASAALAARSLPLKEVVSEESVADDESRYF